MAKKQAGKLIFKILFALIFGALLGKVLTLNEYGIFALRGMITVSDLISQFLAFFVPIVVLTLVLPGIIELGGKASKMLITAVFICYFLMVGAGFISFFFGQTFIPQVFHQININGELAIAVNYEGFLPKLLSPFLDVVGAIVIAFTFGLSAAAIKSDVILIFAKELEKCVYNVLNKFLIPILPFYIACIFAKLSASGELFANIQNFTIVIFAIFLISNFLTLILMFIGSVITKRNFFKVFKAYLPAYFVALGTQSSKATIPISLQSAIDVGVSKEIAEFSVPLLATIHLLGSVVTQIFGAMSVFYIFTGEMIGTSLMISYIFLIAAILLAAPGIPGGEPVATKPLLSSFLGFPPVVAETMFTLGIANDSFSTSVNVASDSFVVLILDKLNKKWFKSYDK